MRIYVESQNQPSPARPRQLALHAHYRRPLRHFELLDALGDTVATVHLDDVRDAVADRYPLPLTPEVGPAFTLPLGALERLLSCVETRTDSGDTLEIDGSSLLLNGRYVATLPPSVRGVTFMPIRTQYLRDMPRRFVAILGRGGAYFFDLLTHQILDATRPATTAQRVAGGVA